MRKNVFTDVYTFTTENISGYFPSLDLKDKSLLTVGSSGDQAFNAILCGAGKVTVMDISPYAEGFIKLKRDMILNYPRRQMYYRTLCNDEFPVSKDYFPFNDLERMNPYMSSDEKYDELRSRLEHTDIDFIEGDIFNMSASLGKESFDRIVFSNILQYVDHYASSYDYNDVEAFIRDSFCEWDYYLNKDGILQLTYLYSLMGQKRDLVRICSALYDKEIYLSKFDNGNNRDKAAILYYRK